MDSQTFRNLSANCHETWLGNLLNLSRNNAGIDLTDDEIGVEVKSRYGKWNLSFPVHEYQIDEFFEDNPGKELFWAFLIYDLIESPSNIEDSDIEKYVSSREVWMMHWPWINQFETFYPESGPYKYPRKKDFPPEREFTEYEFDGARLYVPREAKTLRDRLS